MSTSAFLVVAIAILGFGLISRRLQKSVLTPPMAFVALGWLVSEQGLGLLHLHLEGELIHLLAETTLVPVRVRQTRYARRTDQLDREAAERREVSEMPVRIRH